MEIGRQSAHGHFEIAVAARAVKNERLLRAEHHRVDEQNGITMQPPGSRNDKVVERGAGNFLFAFDEQLNVDRQPATRLQPRYERGHHGHHLPFIVRGAAGVEVIADDDWGERRRAPFGERIGGLNVVMAVDEQSWHRLSAKSFAVDSG